MEANERIRIFLKAKKITIQNFEALIGRTNGYLSHTKSPTANVLKAIAEKFPELNLYWLITGEGDMLKTETAPATADPSGQVELLRVMLREKDARIEELKEEIGALKVQVGFTKKQVSTK